MKQITLLLALAAAFLLPTPAAAAPAVASPAIALPSLVLAAKTVHVKSYTKKDGTHVRSHTRSAPRRK